MRTLKDTQRFKVTSKDDSPDREMLETPGQGWKDLDLREDIVLTQVMESKAELPVSAQSPCRDLLEEPTHDHRESQPLRTGGEDSSLESPSQSFSNDHESSKKVKEFIKIPIDTAAALPSRSQQIVRWAEVEVNSNSFMEMLTSTTSRPWENKISKKVTTYRDLEPVSAESRSSLVEMRSLQADVHPEQAEVLLDVPGVEDGLPTLQHCDVPELELVDDQGVRPDMSQIIEVTGDLVRLEDQVHFEGVAQVEDCRVHQGGRAQGKDHQRVGHHSAGPGCLYKAARAILRENQLTNSGLQTSVTYGASLQPVTSNSGQVSVTLPLISKHYHYHQVQSALLLVPQQEPDELAGVVEGLNPEKVQGDILLFPQHEPDELAGVGEGVRQDLVQDALLQPHLLKRIGFDRPTAQAGVMVNHIDRVTVGFKSEGGYEPMDMSIIRSLDHNMGKLSPSITAWFLGDMQAKFRPSSSHLHTIVHHSTRVFSAVQLRSVPTMATEQCPKGLGAVPELELGKFDISPHTETCFTMIRPLLMEEL